MAGAIIVIASAWNHSSIAIETLSTGEYWHDFCIYRRIALIYTENMVLRAGVPNKYIRWIRRSRLGYPA
jgi:hypothetical protein